MTRRPRRTHSAEFKAKIAQEAIKGRKTVHEIAQEHGLLPNQVSTWKNEALEKLTQLFEKPHSNKDEQLRQQRREATLERKIGQLLIEKEFLEKKCVQLGIDLNEKP